MKCFFFIMMDIIVRIWDLWLLVVITAMVSMSMMIIGFGPVIILRMVIMMAIQMLRMLMVVWRGVVKMISKRPVQRERRFGACEMMCSGKQRQCVNAEH